jgi:hypothetical protein
MEQYRNKLTIQVFMQVTEETFDEAVKICDQLKRYHSYEHDLMVPHGTGTGYFINDFGCYLVKDQFGRWNLWSPDFLKEWEPVSAPSVAVLQKDQLTDLRNSFYDEMPSRGEIKTWDMIEWSSAMFRKFDEFIDALPEPEARQIAGVQWVNCKERLPDFWIKDPHPIIRNVKTKGIIENGYFMSYAGKTENWAYEKFEWLNESGSSLSTAKEPGDRDEIRALAYRTFVSTINRLKKADFSDGDKDLLLDRLEKAFDWLEKTPSPSPGTGPRIVQSSVAKEQETAIAFAEWIDKERIYQANSGKWYKRNHPARTSAMAETSAELYDLFLQSQTKQQ